MTIGEFELIEKFFAAHTIKRNDVTLGIGDDAAIVNIPPQQQLVITTDTLTAGVHFPATTCAYDIGYKSIAVNLSDLAAMGATPSWVTLALTLSKVDDRWLQDFCQGFFDLASRYQIQLIGGDTSQGPLSITVEAFGFTPFNQALMRSHAKPGDLIYVTGTLGEAALGLQYLQGKVQLSDSDSKSAIAKLNRPEPQIEIGTKLRGIANAAIDISDGLAADLGHILEKSHVGALINLEKIPIGSSLLTSISNNEALALALTGGDEYELCFTVPPQKLSLLEKMFPKDAYHLTCIGTIVAQKGLDLRYKNGEKYSGKLSGYEHFQK